MEVLTQKITSTIVGSSEVKSGQFSIDVDNFTHITKLLSKSLYSNPIRTLMIEYVQNAIDSHTNIKSNKKIIVTLPSEAVPYYNVQDFGEGMSQEFVIDKLTKYGTSTNIISILQQYIQKPLNCNIDNISTDIRLLCKYISNLINSSFIILPYNSDIPETHSFKDAFKLHDHSTWILYNIRQYQNYGLIYDMIFTRTFFDEWKDDAIQLINLIFKPFDIDYSDYVTFKRFINVFKCSDITIFDKNQKQYMDLLSHVHMFNKHSHNVKEQITRIGKIVKMIQNSIFKR